MTSVGGKIHIPPLWLERINNSLSETGYKYKMYSIFRPNKNYMQITLYNDVEEKIIKINYRENFQYTWSEFIDILKEKLK